MAMLPFCGYNMGHYFRHWLRMRKNLLVPPRIFLRVNWFAGAAAMENISGPASGEKHMRVLKWIAVRTVVHGCADAWREAALGWVPGPARFLTLGGMEKFDSAKLAKAQEINLEEWRRESLANDELSFKLHSDVPKELAYQRELLVARL